MEILIIGDTQCSPEHDLTYMSAIGEYIVEKRPEVIVHIGDHFDFPSLSSYDKGKKSFEGRRLIEDINAGLDGMDRLLAPLKRLQKAQTLYKKRVYKPRMVYCMGNHEDRFNRMANDMPELSGFVGMETLDLEQYGWEVYPFLKPVEIEGIYFVHYLANPMTGRPYTGTAAGQLKLVGRSFVAGHKQVLDVAIQPTIDGQMRIGIINGACYEHDEDYMGPQGNHHWRGCLMLNDVNNGGFEPMPLTLKYLNERYA